MTAITTSDSRQLADPAKDDRLVELEAPEAWWDLTGPLAGLAPASARSHRSVVRRDRSAARGLAARDAAPRPRVLLVANRTTSDRPLIDAVRRRATRGPATFHLVVTPCPTGLHRVVDPEVCGRGVALQRLQGALPFLSEAAAERVTGSVGDHNPLAAVEDALNMQGFDEVILATPQSRVSRWLRLDLASKVRALGKPVLHVTGSAEGDDEADLSVAV